MKKIITPWMAQALAVVFCATAAVAGGGIAKKTYTDLVDAEGNICLSNNYRQNWSHLGSWIVADPKAPGHGFHDVYTQQETVEAYRQNGRFPDGAVMIKEIRAIASGERSTGKASWAGKNTVWFVMVKDTIGRFTGNAHWGDGWGWAFFEAGNHPLNTSKGYMKSCQGCHQPAKASDWVYIEGYPTLKP